MLKTFLCLVDPAFGHTAAIDSRNSVIASTPVVQESWFEKLVEFVTGKPISLVKKDNLMGVVRRTLTSKRR